jgi:hypothetical protein
MTLNDLQQHALFQTNNDFDDLNEFDPALTRYINEGYDKLCMAYAGRHLDEEAADGGTTYYTLSLSSDEVDLPEWMHRAIGDYATYMLYRNGNALKQNRGIPFYQMFEEVRKKAEWEGKAKNVHFYNLYKEP